MYITIVPPIIVFFMRVTIIFAFTTSVVYALIGSVKYFFSKNQETKKTGKRYLRRSLLILLGLVSFVMIIVAIEQNVPNAGMGLSKSTFEFGVL